MAKVLRMAIYSVKSTLRNKSVLFWSLAWPVLWVLLFAYVFMPPASGAMGIHAIILDNDLGPTNTSGLGALGLKPADFTKLLTNAFATANTSGKTKYYIRLIKNACTNNLSECVVKARKFLIYKGFDAAIIVPENASQAFTLWLPVRLIVLVKGGVFAEEYMRYGAVMNVLARLDTRVSLERVVATAKLLRAYVPAGAGGFIRKYFTYALYGIAFPTYPHIRFVKPKSIADRAGMLGWMTLGAIGMSLMTTMLTSGAGFLAFRRAGGILRRWLASPASTYALLCKDLIETLILTALIAAVTIAVGLGLGAKISFNPLNPADYLAVAMIFLAGIFAFGLGFILAPSSRSAKVASASTAIGLILTFTTGIWWPPKSMLPTPLREFASVFPPACAFQALRDILVWSKPLQYTLDNIIIAVAGSAALYIAIGVFFTPSRLRRIAERFL